MQQTEKHRTQKPSWPTKYQADVRDLSDAQWKYLHKHNLIAPPNKSNRRQPGATAEPPPNYHIPINAYKQQKHHSCASPTHAKYATMPSAEPHRWAAHSQTRAPRNKIYTTNNNNVAVVRKPIYKNELEDEENLRYADEELGNFTEDNAEEEVVEEVDEDPEETVASVDKDYEEQEADDEIDEESDSPLQLRSQKLQRRLKKEGASQEQQRLRLAKQQDPRKHRIQEYVQNTYEGHPLRRRYYHDAEDPDVTEVYSEEELIRPPTPPKNSVRRSATNHHQHWTPIRSSSDRYDTIASFNQSVRRPRPRPEIETFLHSENNAKKCIRCGAPSGSKVSTTSKKNNCRFQEYPSYLMKEIIGDDIDVVDKILCGQCNVRHNTEDVGTSYGLSRAAAVQSLKPRRSKGSKGIYEVSEEVQVADECPNDYITSRYSRDSANIVREKTRHSAPATRGPVRLSSRYDA
ncbi:hypothetical protein KPH14_001476 [Odynerus spinipes]|uniref:Uncharacterized protein n=1 Tax=Odynerus spinipes TaxID=1348599 RepID=A0AAD9VT93_9HYME|nr:hypothetical protein KPH14_001476 [Odynerus spinipes]